MTETMRVDNAIIIFSLQFFSISYKIVVVQKYDIRIVVR